MDDINYESSKVPSAYCCAGCGATGVKLWREYQTVQPQLLCANCAATNQNRNISDMDSDGKYIDSEMGYRSDQIGWYVPAVPDKEGIGYWGYTSVPDAGVKWWKRLPNSK